jgi:hypothetical protein
VNFSDEDRKDERGRVEEDIRSRKGRISRR